MALITPGYFPATYFPSSYWQPDYWVEHGTTWLIRFFAELEKTSVTTTIFTNGVWVVGIFEHTPVDAIISRLES